MIGLSELLEKKLGAIYEDFTTGKIDKAQRKMERLVINLIQRQDEAVHRELLEVKDRPNTIDKRIEQKLLDIEGVE